ncbi:LytR/AlgR family response regulator transcription factor [Aquimarina hainanensis]|uniref:LytR/AlgR family response regulator transcription factor n=1 Tax=Aquimarina hainanensis TaxID=1578017 RepID=A0ABW5N9F5_9FLAO
MNSIITSIIVEDQECSSNYLKSVLNDAFPEIRVLAIETSISGALSAIETYRPDLIFLDIYLSDGVSFEVIERTSYTDFEIIFTTAHDTFYQKAFEYCAFNYILKPITAEKLSPIIEKFKKVLPPATINKKKKLLHAFLDKENPRIIINLGDENLFVPIKDIVACKAEGSYCSIVFSNKNHLTSKPLKYYEELLEGRQFFKANRSTLVNIAHITRIHKRETLILSNNESIKVSVRNRNMLSDLINLHI